MRCYFDVRSKADMNQLNLLHRKEKKSLKNRHDQHIDSMIPSKLYDAQKKKLLSQELKSDGVMEY